MAITKNMKNQLSLINANITIAKFKAEGIRYKRVTDKKGYVKIVIKTNGKKTLPTSAKDPEVISDIVRSWEQEEIYMDPDDDVSTSKQPEPTSYTPRTPPPKIPLHTQALPDYYRKAIYPATSKPNIDNIKLWVVNVKLNGKSDSDMLEELYGVKRESPINVIGAKEFESLVDKLAYKISRKIWYVGRRPHNLTDNQWNELTKFMRPKEGSYGGGDVWTNFKYTTNYEYTSGVSE